MSKSEVKKYIKSLERSSLEELVMDLYSARKEASQMTMRNWKNIGKSLQMSFFPAVAMQN